MHEFSQISALEGKIRLPGDKSISHRTVILGALGQTTTRADNFLNSDDSLRTLRVFQQMGIDVSLDKNIIEITGKGLRGLKPPDRPLYMGGSGTSLRLILGVLAGQKFKATLTADDSLSNRPMQRVTLPLREMGAKITGPQDANFAPLTIEGGDLKPIEYKMPIASAQVKSAILLAGLYAQGRTRVVEPIASRDHTERMLKLFGAKIEQEGLVYSIEGWPRLKGKHLVIPGDISSAANFMVLAALSQNAHLIIESVGLNPTRTGCIEVLKRMGTDIQVKICGGEDFEPFGDIEIRSSRLKATKITKEEVPRLIDELPILMVAACFAQGKTVIEGAEELRVKETDRINSMVTNLTGLGAKIEIDKGILTIEGCLPLRGIQVSSFGDHRTAMAMIVSGLVIPGKTMIDDVTCINKSFPGFFDILKKIIKR
jgi:3-phosphoshikimate 1-carboxyvinyltransferase